MEIENQLLHTSGVPNRNGHVYNAESVRQAFEKHNDKMNEIWVTPYPTNGRPEINIERIAGKVEHDSIEFCENGEIRGTVKMLGTPMGKIMTALIEDGVSLNYGLIGVGRTEVVDDVTHINEYTLINIGIDGEPNRPKPEAFDKVEVEEEDVNIVLRYIRKAVEWCKKWFT